MLALNCETDFVAKNAGFVELTNKILDAAIANRVANLEALKALEIDGRTVADLVVENTGKTGEKTEISAYEVIEAPATTSYTHFGNKLATIVGFNLENVDYQAGRNVAMQVASMNPIAVDRDSVPASVLESEKAIAIEKTKDEQVRKAVDAALKKAGLNPNHFDTEDHIESNMSKGWITEEEAAKGRAIMAEVAEQKRANLPAAMIENIAIGRVNKFCKESCLMEQEFINDAKMTIAQYLDSVEKGLVAVAFKRVNLNQD